MNAAIIPKELLATVNARLEANHLKGFQALGDTFARRGLNLDQIVAASSKLELAVPSWGFTPGGTPGGRFQAPREAGPLEERLRDAAVVNELTGVTPRVCLRFPCDKPADPAALRRQARTLKLGFDAIHSSTSHDPPGQKLSYKFGSLGHADPGVRRQAIEQNLECIQLGKALGSKALTVRLADGGRLPGQQHLRRALDHVIDSLENIYSALPPDWRLLTEPTPFGPACYAAIIPDWGTSCLIAQALGPQAGCLVDLSQHLPNCNLEQVVARLIFVNRLGGLHFNDSISGDRLSAGSIKPYQLFLIFNELVDAALDPQVKKFRPRFAPAYMLDQSPNLKDPIEDLLQSAVEIHRAHAKALLVDRSALTHYQETNDVVMAERTLKQAFETDVSLILAEVRRRRGAALEPLETYRASGYRQQHPQPQT